MFRDMETVRSYNEMMQEEEELVILLATIENE